MKLTSVLNLSFLLLVSAIVVALLISTAYNQLQLKCKKSIFFLVFNLLTAVVIFTGRRNQLLSDEYEQVPEVCVAASDDEQVTSNNATNLMDHAGCDDINSRNSGDEENDFDDDDEDIDFGELQTRADEFIAKTIRGWMEERLRNATLICPN
ncbi:uncharacterized protein A4U43_C10F12060 [Asparagus officinalis]|uniref:Uncharacterized protein n=1 Tax=Asparagus officinalis TaxID=4686 RepID=A0A5P1E274_ASPOF|nr:uncharacterized protein A4U43_C10F12060 [Asparagus officinalis]